LHRSDSPLDQTKSDSTHRIITRTITVMAIGIEFSESLNQIISEIKKTSGVLEVGKSFLAPN
jgi:hypothetical protein